MNLKPYQLKSLVRAFRKSANTNETKLVTERGTAAIRRDSFRFKATIERTQNELHQSLAVR